MDNINLEKFKEDGYLGPFKLLNNKDRNKLLNEQYIPLHKRVWQKSIHEKALYVRNLAKNKGLVSIISEILGKNILLWSSCFIKQKPKNTHGWHIDIEHAYWDGITVWLGLKNLNNLTPLSLISGSHLIELSPQELIKKGINSNDDEQILNEARKINKKCEIKKLYLKEGEFIIWSGRIWHNTHNFSSKNRESIILQYTSTNNNPKIPKKYDYPKTEWLNVMPPCLLISGKNVNKNNKITNYNDGKGYNFAEKIKLNIYKFKFYLSSLKNLF